MVSPIYTAFNVLYQLGTLIFLWIANKDMNDDFIPGGFFPQFNDHGKASNSSMFIFFLSKMFVLLVEAAILILIVSAINQLILRATESHKKRKAFASQTLRVNLIVNFVFIIFLMWAHFMGGLW
jgi:hypothetical protein